MIRNIKGLHHITSLASGAGSNNRFFTQALGLRRVKKTVNFDAPDLYHLYYGDRTGSPGTVMTYFTSEGMERGHPGTGEVSMVDFAVPKGALGFWKTRLGSAGVALTAESSLFGAPRLEFTGPDGDAFALVESDQALSDPWTGTDIPAEAAIQGFHGARFRLRKQACTEELLSFMGYLKAERQDGLQRFTLPHGGPGAHIDLEELPGGDRSRQGAGSVHHIAFSVANRQAQLEVHQALTDAGFRVTDVIDRDYFWAIYFRSPGGVLFEVATDEPGFDRDEDIAHLGEALKLPSRYEPHRAEIERKLPAMAD